MKREILLCLAVALIGARGQELQSGAQPPDTTAERAAPAAKLNPATNLVQKASTFIGSTVADAEGKQIGKIEDLVFEVEKGKIGYAVIALETRRVAIPVSALKPVDGKAGWTLNMSEAVLAAAEGLSEGNWPAVDAFAVGGPAQTESGSASSEEAPQTESEQTK